MGVGTDSKVSKRRATAPGSEEARQARREQNREAQVVYRQRKHAAEAAQQRRLRRLEEIVEEMSSVLVTFVDDLLSYDVVNREPELLDSLRKTVGTVSSLAKEVVDSDDTETASVAVAQVELIAAVPQPGNFLSDEAIPDTEQEEEAKRQIDIEQTRAAADAIKKALLSARPVPTEPDEGQQLPQRNIQGSLKIPHQLFGNGWLPQGYLDPPAGLPACASAPAPKFSPGALPVRIIEGLLASSYATLLNQDPVPGSSAYRIFRLTLQFYSREELLYQMRWTLGPGRGFLPRAVDIPVNRYAKLLAMGKPVITRVQRSDSGAGTASYTEEVAPSQDLLSIKEVNERLQSLDARFVDHDTLEMTIRGPKSSEQVDRVLGKLSDGPAVENAGGSGPLTVRLSAPLLIRNLGSVSLCLYVGPAIPADDFCRMVESSIISVR